MDAVGRGEAFELEADDALLLGPDDALRAQGIGGAHHIDEVPATVAALPLAGVGIEEVAVEAVARDLVVETQSVVARHAGTRLRQFGVQPGHEFGFAQAALFQASRGNAGDQAGGRVRQDVVTGPAIEVQRLTDLVKCFVRANASHLQWAVTARVDAGGFIVVPEDAGVHCFSLPASECVAV